MRFPFLASMLMTSALVLQAQWSPRPQEAMMWDGKRVITVEEGSTLRFRIEEPGKKDLIIQAPEKAHHGYHWNGCFWATRKVGSSASDLDFEVLKSTHGSDWHRVALFQGQKGPKGILMKAYPLHNDRFLMLSSPRYPFVVGGKPYWVALGQIASKGILEPTSGIDLGTELPLHIAKGPNAFEFEPNLYPILDPLFGHALRTDRFILMVSFHYGWIWVFDFEGRLKRFSQLYASVKNDREIAPHRYERVILSCQPNDRGNLIVASRTEDAVINVPKIFPTHYNLDTLRHPDRAKEHEANLIHSLKAFPLIQWWEFNPETGEKWEIPAPIGLPTHLDEPGIFQKFRFRFRPDGNLKAFY